MTRTHLLLAALGLALGGISGYIAQTSSWRNAFSWFGAAGMTKSQCAKRKHLP